MRYMSQWRGTPIYGSRLAAESRELSNYEEEVVQEVAWRQPVGFLPKLSNMEKTAVLGAAIAAAAWWYFKKRK